MYVQSRLSRKAQRQFVDSIKVLLCSGCGGDGASIMTHEHSNEFGGPGGGDGGDGGNVLLRCVKNCTDLRHIANMGSQLAAGAGSPGYARKAHGKRGRDLWLDVPVGTEVVDVDTNEVVFDLDEAGVQVLLLEGGRGGKGNASFANKSYHSPVESTRGLPGNTMLAQIELKTIADCGFIGYPNAGKSSLLAAISSSRPTIAPYAFTTLQPYVGVIHDLYGNSCRVADIPGLIEGAYENRGLGHRFLRHVERSKALAFVVDVSSTHSAVDPNTPLQPWDVLSLLQSELDYYMPGLSQRAIMVFANKMDVKRDSAGIETSVKLDQLRQRTSLPVFPVSAALGLTLGAQHADTGLPAAVQHMCNTVFAAKARERNAFRRRRKEIQAEVTQAFNDANNGLFEMDGNRGDDDVSRDDKIGSLVDQQLDDVGDSGLGESFDGFDSSLARGKLQQYRDLTMRGRYWCLTRNVNEKMTGERWK